MHWVEAPGCSAISIRNYFESLKKGIIEYGKMRYASTQYIIDIDGTVVRTMPDGEIAYHCGSAGKVDPVSGKMYTDLMRQMLPEKYLAKPYTPDYATIGVEMCHRDSTGEFSKETLDSAVELVTSFFYRYPRLKDPDYQIIRHKDVVGHKSCPKWFVDNPDAFLAFKQAVEDRMKV
jgi:N-acetylmuramoyl-L-alanine amidase CwlA